MSIKIWVGILGLVIILGLVSFTKSISFPPQPAILAVTTSISPIPSPILPDLSLERIFDSHTKALSQFDSPKFITIIATGDVIPARVVNVKTNQSHDFTWPYQKTSEFLKNSDLTFINLEAPLLKNCPINNLGMIFCGDSRNVQGLVASGIDLVSLANNHAGNYGKEGVEETKVLLNQNGIQVTGIDGPKIIEIKGTKFAFLGYNDISVPQPGVSNAEEEKIKTEIHQAKSQADVVIVTYHWGEEYRAQPDDRQIYLGHLTIDSGADLVIGNHPHWVQPIELYKGKLITYAHGNFVFDQEWSQKTKEGVVGKYTFDGANLIDVEYFPVEIKDWGQPYFLEGVRKQQLLWEMKQESLKLVEKKI